MDHKAKESSWQAKALNIFKKGAGSASTTSPYNQQENVKKYKNALHKKIKIWWTKITLENYIAQQIIPRGLRVHLFPTFDLNDESLKERWIKAANTCSFEFINIIIESNMATLRNIETEIDSLQKILQQKLKADCFQEKICKLDKEIEKWEGTISQNKQKKYERDLADFDSNKIFKWQTEKTSIRRNISRSSSIISNSSLSEGGESTHNIHKGPRTRQFTKRGPIGGSQNRKDDSVKVINLSTHILTNAQESVLQKGLSFSPSSTIDTFTTIKDLHLFSRKLVLKKLHYKDSEETTMNTEEQQALEALVSLLEENTTSTNPPLTVYLLGNSCASRGYVPKKYNLKNNRGN
ncbi:uncharacterized protein [Ranitomeya imitator]|uniref:uncharacterized protein n=1 Tax=Ranitomeya imitator TaxID=111125 RepID=UPI0037E72CDF